MYKILLTGINGQVGRSLQPILSTFATLIGTDRATLDLTEPDRIRQAIAQLQPDLIINTAAYTQVDRAETEPELANAVNAIAPMIMAEEAERLGSGLIHLSSNYVFDGNKRTPYCETDESNPINEYGHSKQAGERGIQQRCDRHLILRTAWVYGAYGQRNFVKTILKLASQQDELRIVADQFSTPTWSHDLAHVIAHIAQLYSSKTQHPTYSKFKIQNSKFKTCPTLVRLSATRLSRTPKSHVEANPQHPPGIYHITNGGVASWYDVAIAVVEEAKQMGVPLRVRRIVPITTADYPTLARRPAYSVLAHQKISQDFAWHPPHWRQSLRQMLAEFFICTR